MSVVVTIAARVSTDGRREVLDLSIGASGAVPFWSEFLGDLVRRGLSGVKLVINDAHEGLKVAIALILVTCWRSCRVHFHRNAGRAEGGSYLPSLPRLSRSQGKMCQVSYLMRSKLPKLSALVDSAEEDVLDYMTFPVQHRTKLHSTKLIERFIGEING